MARLMKALWKALGTLVAPSAHIQEPEKRRRALLLNTLLFVYTLFVWVVAVALFHGELVGSPYFSDPKVKVVVTVSLVLFMSFFLLAKTRHYVVAGLGFCFTICLGILVSVAISSSPGEHTAAISYLIIPVLIAMFVLPLWAVLATAGVSFLCGVILGFLETGHLPGATFSLWFFLVALALVLAGALLRTFDIRQMEDERLQLFHAARMATLGEMAGSIAHEVNNPVAVIQLRASQALRVLNQHPDEPGKVAEFLEAIKRTASHIESVVRSLRSFSRSGLADPFVLTPLQAIITDTRSLCEEHLRHVNVELKVEPFDETLAVECRAIQISQILLNLINNARVAVQGLPERWIRIEVADKEEIVAISVTDSGKGIPPTIAKKIFEPFFTTKQDGLGTGIGLSISLNLAKQNNGNLYLDPNSSHTRFVLEIRKSKGNKDT